jgi:hypothetical protein
MKYNFISQQIIKRRKEEKRRENIKDAILIALIIIIGNLVAFWSFNLMDRAYEERAAAAGYKLPTSQMRNL